MKVCDLVIGGVYGRVNKRGNEDLRMIIDFGMYKQYESQNNEECLMYICVKGGKKGYNTTNRSQTKQSFASWAQYRVD